MTFLETILDELLKIFKKNGIDAYTDEELIKQLDIRSTTFQELFPNRIDMVNKVIAYSNELQKQEHVHLLANAQTPVEELILLLKDGIKDLKSMNPRYITDLQQNYPQAWAIAIEHLNSYSYHQLFDIINRSIVEGLFRKDINIQLVVKIILEQLFLILNPSAFPPDKFDTSEVFRSIYLYYIRGLCSEQGAKTLDGYFANNKF